MVCGEKKFFVPRDGLNARHKNVCKQNPWGGLSGRKHRTNMSWPQNVDVVMEMTGEHEVKLNLVQKMKHTDRPKSPMNAYIWFTKDIRNQVIDDWRAANPDAGERIDNKEIICRLSQLWLNATPAERAKYEPQAAEDRKRYMVQIAKFEADNPEMRRRHVCD